ncbi:MAG: hypothetical protein U0231_14550 [Nitrospiraceae bacterium]
MLYTLADVFVFPSLYEGFGMPVPGDGLRALFSCCLDNRAMPEVAETPRCW